VTGEVLVEWLGPDGMRARWLNWTGTILPNELPTIQLPAPRSPRLRADAVESVVAPMADAMQSRLTTAASTFAAALLAAVSAAQALPPGHPASPADAVPVVPAGAGTGATGLAWVVPGDWKAETPSSSMRRAQYRVPGPGGDAECVVFYFGPGQGGDASSNAARWASQFRAPEGGGPAPAPKTAGLRVGDLEVTTVDVEGTYAGGVGGAATGGKHGYRLVGAIVAGPDANWFFKLTGPGKTVAGQAEAFFGMIRSLKKGS